MDLAEIFIILWNRYSIGGLSRLGGGLLSLSAFVHPVLVVYTHFVDLKFDTSKTDSVPTNPQSKSIRTNLSSFYCLKAKAKEIDISLLHRGKSVNDSKLVQKSKHSLLFNLE